MKCNTCGSDLVSLMTDLPFKINNKSIIIIKELPVLQCGNCYEYLLEDPVMKRVDEILQKADYSAELEIVRFAA